MFGPVIEHKYVDEAFLTDNPAELIKKPKHIPWILGVTSDEGALGSVGEYLYLITNTPTVTSDNISPSTFQFYSPTVKPYATSIKTTEKYSPNSSVTSSRRISKTSPKY